MSLLSAYAGGVHACFSIWVFCLLQIIPFFAAFTVGAALTAPREMAPVRRLAVGAGLGAVSVMGFMAVFMILGLPTTAASQALFDVLEPANQSSGVVVGLWGAYFIGLLTLDDRAPAVRAGRWMFAFLFGCAVAVAYKPCVTPTLTRIIQEAQAPDSVARGAALLAAYTLGVFTPIGAGALALAWAAVANAPAKGWLIRAACGAALAVLAALILTGWMTVYKSLLVGGFVE